AQDANTAPQGSTGIAGYWQGKLDVGAIALRVGLHIKEKGQDGLTPTLDSPDQGAIGLPVSNVKYKDGELSVALKNLTARFDGKMNKEGSSIAGTWKQGAVELPITFQRLAKAPVYTRPQEPQKPYPYRAQDVSFENKKANIKLAGTLTLPAGEGPFAAVLPITGSGPQDRDESSFRP